MTSLRYGWKRAIERIENGPSVHSVRDTWTTCVFARLFVRKWADWAEKAGMQPAHLLSYLSEDRRGLAWRWTKGTELLCFPKPGFVIVEAEVGDVMHAHSYRFEADGGCVRLPAAEHKALMGAKIDLDKRPSLRAINIANQVAADLTLTSAFAEKLAAF